MPGFQLFPIGTGVEMTISMLELELESKSKSVKGEMIRILNPVYHGFWITNPEQWCNGEGIVTEALDRIYSLFYH